ncbi:hypothetical protein KUV62_15905 [Salipiger bermudensis]|uniref:hypothetical protein n=1 Tax=Salipiger bermudensis TaxID=344736 RepID=UPI001C99FBF6|nr:hypothetical protein [Salipiger bermudensis]MBY6005410.1 hypothetical protein [Salipiger bermudensis]
MSLIDEIRENAKKGTPGPWDYHIIKKVWRFGLTGMFSDVGDPAIVIDLHDGTADRTAARIAAVPRMEAALLAAEEIAESFAARLDGEGGTPHEYAALAAFREACK